ncbi:MCE family protein [Nocardia puris]|uniref:Phospholipid/cholesterol/gamma-HCH transport system substrate-binding protein n=1 Tax=Nocardia puris TaxID=208602 RepID=A0A366DQ68_9NOCA|nr:MlaD family protein [Nocardia puris]MBF6213636.1 MCE family protein [Nocardia puris]MBF6365434.1 MCE family protein [Nocardia puris]MBF6459900.1 MCE family protein [Nocardia puris]RBO91619.1 phospholipid/cholesterol/gamma-HCH transport system substrate-binding protein [Nocardia puris]
MSIRKPLIGFGIFAIVSILVTVVVWNTLARTVTGATNTYTATFTDVLGLREGDDVRMAGVRVGKVEKIELGRDEETAASVANVTFIVQRDQTIYDDTKALVRYQNLIGQRYVALQPGDADSPAPLENKAKIPLARTEPSFDVSGLLNGFQPLFQVLQPEQVNRLSETFIQALQGDNVSLSSFIVQAAQLASDFQRRDAILSDVIVNLSGVMQGLAKRGDELETLVTQTRALIGGLYEQGQSLQASTVQIADATTALVGMVDRIQPGLEVAQNSTSAALSLLLANGAKLDQAAIDLPNVLSSAGRHVSEGAYANAYLCGLDVSLYGVLFPRGLFSQIGGTSNSAVCRP